MYYLYFSCLHYSRDMASMVGWALNMNELSALVVAKFSVASQGFWKVKKVVVLHAKARVSGTIICRKTITLDVEGYY